MGVFPFGRPVVACEPVATGRAAMFVLGAYPSALHVRWRPPQGEGRVVQALVDNEPEPFWTGADEVHRVEEWMSQVGWSDAWGAVAPVSHLNGCRVSGLRSEYSVPLVSIEPTRGSRTA